MRRKEEFLKTLCAQVYEKKEGVVETLHPATNMKAVATWFGTVGRFEGRASISCILGKSNLVVVRRSI